MTMFRTLALVGLAACGTPRPTATPVAAPPPGPMMIVDAEQTADALRLRWPDGLAAPAGTFTLIDSTGVLGTARVVGPSKVDCDDCHVSLVDLAWIDQQRPCKAHCVALGPAALARARIIFLGAPDWSSPSWQPMIRIDLDGDSRWDLEQLGRCGGTTASGCNDHVCNKRCIATHAVKDTNPDRATISCFTFVPDVTDCAPSPAGG